MWRNKYVVLIIINLMKPIKDKQGQFGRTSYQSPLKFTSEYFITILKSYIESSENPFEIIKWSLEILI